MRYLAVAMMVTAGGMPLHAQTPSSGARPVNAFYELRSDGTGWKKLFEISDVYPCNSPRVSADGSWLAFDAWNSRRGQKLPDAHIFTCRLDGSDLKDLGPGSMPSWGPEGKQLAFCRYGHQQGVWLIDANGKNAELIDREGWGVQWSPDGRSLAFTRRSQVVIFDVAARAGRPLFPGDGAPYSQIYWNMTWGADSSHLALMASLEDGSRELAIVDVRGAEYGFQRLIAGQFNPMLSWSSDGKRLVFPERTNPTTMRLSELDPSQMETSRAVPGIPAGARVASACWLPDGSKLIVLVTEP